VIFLNPLKRAFLAHTTPNTTIAFWAYHIVDAWHVNLFQYSVLENSLFSTTVSASALTALNASAHCQSINFRQEQGCCSEVPCFEMVPINICPVFTRQNFPMIADLDINVPRLLYFCIVLVPLFSVLQSFHTGVSLVCHEVLSPALGYKPQ
jgi:hypothetical protein